MLVAKATVAAWNTVVTQAGFSSSAGPAWPIGRQHNSMLLPSRRQWQAGVLVAFPERQKCQVRPQVKITSSKPVAVELFTPDLHGTPHYAVSWREMRLWLSFPRVVKGFTHHFSRPLLELRWPCGTLQLNSDIKWSAASLSSENEQLRCLGRQLGFICSMNFTLTAM